MFNNTVTEQVRFSLRRSDTAHFQLYPLNIPLRLNRWIFCSSCSEALNYRRSRGRLYACGLGILLQVSHRRTDAPSLQPSLVKPSHGSTMANREPCCAQTHCTLIRLSVSQKERAERRLLSFYIDRDLHTPSLRRSMW